MDDLDAWHCPDCGGNGRVSRYHKVTHQLGTDELPFWDECETCGGIGYCGPDAEAAKKAAKNVPNLPPAIARALAPFAPPSSDVHRIVSEAGLQKADRHYHQLKTSGELDRRNDQRARDLELRHSDGRI